MVLLERIELQRDAAKSWFSAGFRVVAVRALYHRFGLVQGQQT